MTLWHTDRPGEWEGVYVWEQERAKEGEIECVVCVSEREILDDNKIPWLCDIQRSERESKRVCMCVSEWEFKGECVCESVCVWERES